MTRFDGPFQVRYLEDNEQVSRYTWPDQNYTRQKDDGDWIIQAEPGVIYVDSWREDGQLQRIHFICPCGECKTLCELNLDPAFSPHWFFEVGAENTRTAGLPTIHPSVHRVGVPAGCHFFIRQGMVQWC